MLFSVFLLSLVVHWMDSNSILIQYVYALCFSLAVEVYIQLLCLRHCVPSLLRFRVRNSGVQDNVYVIVPIIFGPVAQLYISHIQEQNNFIKTKPRNIFCLFFRENWKYLNPLVPSIKRKSPDLIFGPVRFNKTISSFKGSIIKVSCLLAVVR